MNMKYAMRSEDTEQINVVSWANWNMNRYPELRWLFHVPNGGSRNKQEAIKVIEEYLNLALCYCPEEDFNNKMSIPNNSILKDGKVKGGRS